MIQKTITYTCRSCGSKNIVKNGTNRLGQQQYHCKDCDVHQGLESIREAKKDKDTILKACQERVSLREIERIFSVARQQVAIWGREHVQDLPVGV